MPSNSFQIRPIAGALGAEIARIDLSQDLHEGTIAATRRDWLYAPAGASIARSGAGRATGRAPAVRRARPRRAQSGRAQLLS
ncbi:MAG TPA: hypothetical protein VNW89_17400 [Stellaceae bacterium]|jgi:hypothetical protein|nr:hypothetical protein [Stellaceae bacterium]